MKLGKATDLTKFQRSSRKNNSGSVSSSIELLRRTECLSRKHDRSKKLPISMLKLLSRRVIMPYYENLWSNCKRTRLYQEFRNPPGLIMRKHRDKHRRLYIASLDVEKAFGHVPYKLMVYVIENYRNPKTKARSGVGVSKALLVSGSSLSSLWWIQSHGTSNV